MTSNMEQGQWNQVKGSIWKFFSKLTDDDLTTMEGNADKLFGVLHERYSHTGEQAQDQWDKFTRRYGDVVRT